MTLILLEALGAGLLLVLIVWWTMFSGRDKGEPPQDADAGTVPPLAAKDGTPLETRDATAAAQRSSSDPQG